jgi:aliphatic nitrilase
MNGSGATLKTFPTEYGQLSTLICGENANPFAVSAMAADYPVVHVANWPTNFVPKYVSMPDSTLMVSRSISYSCKSFVISSCGVNSPELIDVLPLTEEDREILKDPSITGGSAIIAPGGVVLAGPWIGHEEGILYAEADLEQTVHGRLIHDFGGHYNRVDVFNLQINRSEPSLISYTESFQSPKKDPTDSHSEACVDNECEDAE